MDLSIQSNFEQYQGQLEAELGEQVTIDRAGGNFYLFQRKHGHRHSNDDATTAWFASKKSPMASKILDLGSGIGSVGLGVLARAPESSKLTAIEAQEISHKLLTANILCNNLTSRVRAIHGDLRDLNLNERFDLITGSPPYFPAGTGSLPPDEQKAYARFELRGTVYDYALAASRHLESGGIFVFCFPTRQKSRCLDLVAQTSIKIFSIRDVVPTPGKQPLFTLYASSLESRPLTIEPPLVLSEDSEEYSLEMKEIQKERGF